MAADQTREPVGANATAGSRLHPDTAALIVMVIVWIIVTLAAALVATAEAIKGVDPTIDLALMGLAWMYVTPWAMPARRRSRRGGDR